jgi:hypothetical protein
VRGVLQTPQGPLDAKGRIVWTAVQKSLIRHGLSFAEPNKGLPSFLA